jgi:hypothetical protein
MGMDWILHIDVDELFHLPRGTLADHFAALAADGVDLVTYHNHEALPEAMEIDDCFRDVTLFKRNPADCGAVLDGPEGELWRRRGQFFLAYVNGKSAARLRDGVLPLGPHLFQFPREVRSVAHPEARVLHYFCCGFSRYWRKYSVLAAGAGRRRQWFDEDPHFRFYSRSRDLLRGDDKRGAWEHYRAGVLVDAAEVRRQLASGTLARITGPATWMRERRAALAK